ncbi:Bug family tripartite tricarboxylate transporter substrate binding protein [Ottowia thiooxydans]|uniref:Bug family tripartite tricarboxylate transporter substrate binding protein n=1 Tax=Ottowia thiooxydans TaxID=219182 RepID=UPI000404D3D9|nr:tripartite tricarboxylate transporter substrate binding protein [Ottowia thiooxydans]
MKPFVILPFAVRRAMFLGIAGCFALSAVPALAQDYPNRPIKIIVPYGAGGSVDAIGRTLAQELTQRLGQPVVVENKTGAGSNVGSTFVAKAPADGYTLLLTSPGNAINVTLFKTMPYDVKTELTQVAVVAHAPGILLVRPSFPANNLKEFVAMAKKAPGTLNFGSGGPGSSEHLAAEMFKTLAGIDLTHVPYKGGSAAVNDVLGGHVQAYFTNQANVIGQIKGNAVKVIATAATQRSALLPNVPTFAEEGYPEQQVSVWWGIAAPAKTPVAILDRLNKEILAAGASAGMRQRVAEMGAESLTTTREQANAFLDAEILRWGQAVKSSNAQVN